MTAVSETAKAAGSMLEPVREITVAHSPDSDDAFMFYGLATNKVRTPGLRFTHTLCDIETLNQKAREGVYDVSAISFHAYPYVQDKYALMACGGSVGEGYGPMIVSPRPFTASEIKTKRIAVPGTLTTAYLALQLVCAGSGDRSRALRPDHPAGARRQIRSRAHHSRRPVDLRQIGPAPHCRSWPVVAEGDRLAAAAGRQRDSPRTRSGTDAGGFGGVAREHPVRRSIIAKKRCRTLCSLPAISTRSRPTNSSACTSTNGRSTTVPMAAKPSAVCSTWGTRQGSSGRKRKWIGCRKKLLALGSWLLALVTPP